MTNLIKAVQAVLDRWDGPQWNWAQQGPTGDLMHEMRRAITIPATRPADSQDWAGMDGAIAFHLIERHADGWADASLMMDEWRLANPAQPVQPADTKNFQMTDEHVEILATMLHCVPRDEPALRIDLNAFCHDARSAINKAPQPDHPDLTDAQLVQYLRDRACGGSNFNRVLNHAAAVLTGAKP